MNDEDIRQALDRCFEDPENRSNLEHLYLVLYPHLRAILASISPDYLDRVDDALQDAFLKYMAIFRQGRRVGIEYLRYFVAIAKNCLSDEHRMMGRGAALLEELEELLDPPRYGVDAARIERRILLLQGLASLEPPCRFVLERWYIAGDTADQLASVLEIQSASVYMRLKRCRDELREILAR